jgi:putative endonuclease
MASLRMPYFVYILASKKRGTLYTGVTNNIARRAYEHKMKFVAGFTQKYNIHVLVYYEMHDDIERAIMREKSIKRWSRTKKYAAIEEHNPEWHDLYETLNQ